ncbi:hypothetical protein HDV00_007721 [Rhizophlyctis rosea]|nr:hypothetical protein HDV00_007721 [Rhizophlyctis rosea]
MGDGDPSNLTLFGFPLKYVSLFTLVIQNSALALVLRYSQKNGVSPDGKYLASTAVVTSECIKLLTCLFIHIREELQKPGSARYSLGNLYTDIFGPNSDWLKMTVPAVLYFIQNNLQYLASNYLDAATFQVTYQMKILTTALFSVWMLGRQLTRLKWGSLVLLTVGIALVTYDPSKGGKKDGDAERGGGETFLGLVAVTVACVLSGLAGVWFEKVLKGSKTSLFLRNVQLSIFSVIPGFLFGVMIMDGATVREKGFFHGYNAWTWAAISCQAIGGLIVAMVVKYADNILKGFATSISIILSSIASIFIFGFVVTIPFTLGSAVVLYATHLYGLPDRPRPKEELPYTQVNESEAELDGGEKDLWDGKRGR